ncbi:uncharacterized protein L969DRAFT_92191 [Mixia osmundae IAM 14324]|uniref:uncharacterized protein n=1 Tax=Mixia osmundae (strain CBS 9802 / IAM 14324 / JCM 22182 / KY 12970) TaxID=764103 RepID=UPI0004A54DCE|nr:uncharacterized protein L969DRAFT_92191 [Mixia osmundae IAM 14324]KEI42766.1 hypothetical protein L969DRAFT_92191 [Mixia osmundae IAM 14324]
MRLKCLRTAAPGGPLQLARRYATAPNDTSERHVVRSINELSIVHDEKRKELKAEFSKDMLARRRLAVTWAERKTRKSPSADAAFTPLPLERRRMSDSYLSWDLPLESDGKLLDEYIGADYQIRLGRLLEDLDTLAGCVAYLHILPDIASFDDLDKYGVFLVTAAVDRIDALESDLLSDGPEDLRMSGHVSYTSNSTMEIFMKLQSISESRGHAKQPKTLLVSRFTMACRDKATGRAKAIPQLVTGTSDEDTLLRLGQQQRERKQQTARAALDKQPPRSSEIDLLHHLFLKNDIYGPSGRLPAKAIWINDTQLVSNTITQPVDRNVNATIFGGYLMRLAYELAYATAVLFARQKVSFLALDELIFKLPVNIGELLNLKAAVTFAAAEGQHRSFQVSVFASTTNLSTHQSRSTNTFHFSFSCEEPLQRYVLPRQYWIYRLRLRPPILGNAPDISAVSLTNRFEWPNALSQASPRFFDHSWSIRDSSAHSFLAANRSQPLASKRLLRQAHIVASSASIR